VDDLQGGKPVKVLLGAEPPEREGRRKAKGTPRAYRITHITFDDQYVPSWLNPHHQSTGALTLHLSPTRKGHSRQ
jgi:hypothetical protein